MEDEPAEMEAGMSRDELQRMGQKWLERIKAAEKRDEAWCEDAAHAEKIYLADRDCDDPGKLAEFNILHSNVETIVPSIFNSQPVPDIRERFGVGDESPESTAAREVANALERVISVQIDDNRLDAEIEDSAQDAFVAGRGVVVVRFDADAEDVPAVIGVEGTEIEPAYTRVSNERLRFEAFNWRDYREGPASRWSDVPWIALRHHVPQEEIDRLTDPELKAALGAGEDSEVKPILEQSAEDNVAIWEIWCKQSRRVKLLVEHSGEILRMEDDPLGLPGFFPMPEPVQPIGATGRRRPVCPYAIYRVQADELDTITKRIRALTKILQAKGGFAGDAEGIAALATATDGEIVPLANLEQLAQTGGFDKAILWWPIENIVAVLRELYEAREAVKSSIYEITGISDIIRGQGAASETATAQEIKTQWGSLRIKKMQRLIQRQVRDVFVICAHLISSRFSVETVAKISGMQLSPEAQMMLSQPLDGFRIDVESDSTVRADTQRRRGEMGEFLQGTAAFFQGMMPLMQVAPETAGPITEIFGAFARSFNLGKQAEDAIEKIGKAAEQAAQQVRQMQQQMQEQEANRPRPEELRAQAEGQKLQLQAAQAEASHGLERDKLSLQEQQMELDGLAMLAELELETEQQRAVALGDTNG